MKSLSLVALCLFIFSFSSAQDKFAIPELTQDQKQEVLYMHVISYAASGISYAKEMGSTPEAYGKYVGNLFTPFWNPAEGLPGLANRIMYIFAGIHPANEMQIMDQDENSLRIRLKNVDQPFKQGPFLGVSYDEYLAFSGALLTVLADFMKVDLSQKMVNEWYELSLKTR